MLRKLRRPVILLLALVVLGWSTVSLAFAHAQLVRSDPAANASLPASPTQIQLWFSEDLEPSFSEVTVLDKAGARRDNRDSHMVESDHKSMIVTVPELQNGTYTVVWKTLSAVDGHSVKGGFPFAIGEAVSADALTARVQEPPPDVFSVVVRWINFLAIAPLVGGFVFLLFVRNPVLARISVSPEVEQTADRHFLVLQRWALVGLFLGSICALLLQGATAAGVSPPEALGTHAVQVLTGTRYGLIWVARMALILLLVALLILFARGGLEVRRSKRLLLPSLKVGALLLLTTSLGSHSAASGNEPWLNMLVDWVHLLGAALWLGGLAHLLTLLIAPPITEPRARTALASVLVASFAQPALTGFGLLVVTGVYSAVLQVPDLQALLDTQYGNALGVKLVAFGIMFVLGLVNMQVLGPRLARVIQEEASRSAVLARRLRFTIGLEALLGTVVLLAVGVMTSVAPARDAVAQPGVRPLIETASAEGIQGTLRSTPFSVGLNSFEIYLRSPGGAPIEADRLTLQFAMQSDDMGVQEMILDPIGPGRYRAFSSNLSMAGLWQVEAQVRRKGVEDAVLSYELTVSEESPGKQAAQLPPLYPLPPNAPTLVVELLGAAVVCLAAVWRLGGVRTRQGLVGVALAIVFASAGGVYTASGQLVKPPGNDVLAMKDPIPPDENSIALGQQLFQQNCVVCHGPQGKGDGPAAAGLRPRPVDLTQHVKVHPEGQIFDWITNGVAGSAMPAFRDRLSDEERWHIYNYVKTVLGGSPAAARGP